MLAEKRCIQTGSHRKQPPQADSQEKREQAQVQPLCPVRPVKKSKVSVPVSPWFCLLSALPLVVRFGRSAAQILQNGPRQLGQLGCAPCSPSGGPFWPLSSLNPPKRTSPAWSAWLCSLLSLWWSVLACAPCSPSGGPFWPLSSPNPPKRTSPAWSAWLSSLLSLWWSVLAAQQPKSSKRTSPPWSVVCFGPLRKPKSVKTDFPCSSNLIGLCPPLCSGAPFCPLSGPNPPKRTSPASSAWLCSLLSLWWSVLAAQQPKSSKTDLASLVCLAVLLALPLVVRFGRSAAQILQNGPRQLGLLGCAPCSPSGRPFWPLSSQNPSKRTSPIPPLAAGAGRGRTFNLQVKGLALCRLN